MKKYSKFGMLITAVLLFSNTGLLSQETREQMAERLLQKLQSYQSQSTGITDFGSLSGLWRSPNTDNPDYDIRHILQFKDVLFYYGVEKSTGEMYMHGLAEFVNGQWTGWWELVCRKCCPGVRWWDKGTLTTDNGTRVVVNSFKMDSTTCKLTTRPDQIVFEMNLLKTLDFAEVAPGKLIYVGAAPAVGNQTAQYKALVKLQWDLTQKGVSHFSLLAPGQMLIENGKNLSGVFDYHTTKSGKVDFLLIAYNAKNQFLHFEIRSITIPAIPGL